MEDTVAKLLEFAANNDAYAFKQLADQNQSSVDETRTWYGRQKGLNKMMLQDRTPLMIASTYGSINVLRLILSDHFIKVDVNKSCGHDNTTALHCAASGGSTNAAVIVELLLAVGANRAMADENGHRPYDVIIVSPKFQEMRLALETLLSSTPVERKRFPNRHRPLPDMNQGVFATDGFRMFRFKIDSCSRPYSHDWTKCPFLHGGENARRRDPRKYHYDPVPCPDFRVGACEREDMCQYAHGVHECWMHPDQYRTQMCRDGTSCVRKVCFFAHTREELRSLSNSTSSGVVSAIDYVAPSNLLLGSSSHVPIIVSPPPFSPPVSHVINDMIWNQQNVPALHRLRSSTDASDIDHIYPPTYGQESPFNLAHHEKDWLQFRNLSSHALGSSSRELGSGSSTLNVPSWFEIGNNGDGPDVSWVQALLEEFGFDE